MIKQIIGRRKTLRRGQLTPAEKEDERIRVYNRCHGDCELQLLNTCQGRHLPINGCSPWDHWHLVHLHSKRPAFWSEAQGNVLLGGCPACHLIGMLRMGLKPDMGAIMARRRFYAEGI